MYFSINRCYLLVILALTLLFLISCSKPPTDSKDRFVILSPEIAEIIAYLDGFDRIVGVTDECTFPNEFKDTVKVGKFGSVNLERIVSLKPSHVFTTALEQDFIAAELRKLGINIVSSYPASVKDMFSEILRIGMIIEREKQARELIENMQNAFDSVKRANEFKKRPKVYLEIYRDPLMSVSDNSYVGTLIEAAGGDNIFQVLERDYARVSAEDIIRANPDIIISFSGENKDRIIGRKGWQHVSAIRSKFIFTEGDINPDFVLRAGPRAVLGVYKLSAMFQNYRDKMRI